MLTLSKFKALADDSFVVAKTVNFLLDRVGNLAGQGENASYWHFLLFPQYFQKAPFSGYADN